MYVCVCIVYMYRSRWRGSGGGGGGGGGGGTGSSFRARMSNKVARRRTAISGVAFRATVMVLSIICLRTLVEYSQYGR